MIRHPDYRLSEIPAKYNLDLALMYLGSGGGRALLDLEAGQQQDGNLISAVCRILCPLGGNDGAQPLFYGRTLIRRNALRVPGVAGNGFHFFRSDRRRCICNYVFSCLRRARLQCLHLCLERRGMGDAGGERESIRSNLPYVFHDHQLFTPEERSKIDCIFLTWSDVGSYARLAGEDVAGLEPVFDRQ